MKEVLSFPFLFHKDYVTWTALKPTRPNRRMDAARRTRDQKTKEKLRLAAEEC